MHKVYLLLLTASLILFSCAPVLNKDLMKEGTRNASLDELRANPEQYKGKMYILGGIIVETRFVQNGSQVEVLSLPVDSQGYVQDSGRSQGRFLAVLPKESGLLDPVVYKKSRQVTIAAVFVDAKKSKIDAMEYVYPVFEIKQIHLWEEERSYAYPYYPYNYYMTPYWYNPYWGPWPPPPGWW